MIIAPVMIAGSSVLSACQAALAAVVMASHAPATDPEWVLMSRQGDCVSLSGAAQRKPVFQGVSTPGELIEAVRRQGEAVTVNRTEFGKATVVEVTAPGLGLAVLLVPRSFCSQ